MKLKNKLINILFIVGMLAGFQSKAGRCEDVESWIRNQIPTPVGGSASYTYNFASTDIFFRVNKIGVSNSSVQKVITNEIKVIKNGSVIGLANTDGQDYSLAYYMRQLLPGESFTLKYSYYYKLQTLGVGSCWNEFQTKEVTVRYTPTITSSDFSIAVNNSNRCYGSVRVSITSLKVPIGRTNVVWNLPSTLSYTIVSPGVIDVIPGPGYDPNNTLATISASITIPGYATYATSINTNIAINSLPHGTMTVAPTFRACTYISGPQAPQDGLLNFVIGATNITTPINVTITATHCPSGNCPGITAGLDQTTKLFTINESASDINALPAAIKSKARIYTVSFVVKNANCVLADAQTEVIFTSESFFGSGRLFNGSQASNVGSNIAVVAHDPFNTADDELYFINYGTNKLSRYTFDLTLNDWILQPLFTAAAPKVNTTRPTSNTVAAFQAADGFTYVYYVDAANKIQWVSINPANGINIQNGVMGTNGNFDNIAAGEYLNQNNVLTKYVFGHQPDNSNFIFKAVNPSTAYAVADAAFYVNDYQTPPIYSSVLLLPNGDLIDLYQKNSLVARTIRDSWGSIKANSGNINAKIGTRIQYTEIATGLYNIFYMDNSNSVKYVTYNSTTNPATFSAPGIVTSGVTVKDFAVNSWTGTVYFGNAIAKTLNLTWDINADIGNPAYSSTAVQKIVYSGGSGDVTGFGHYIFAYPHLYYVANIDYGVASPLFNTWYYEGCTPVHLRKGSIDDVYRPLASKPSNAEVPTVAANNSLYCTPNPATDRVSIVFNPGASSKVEISLLDFTGKKLHKITEGTFSGQNSVEIGERLKPGLYIVQMKVNKRQFVSRLVIK